MKMLNVSALVLLLASSLFFACSNQSGRKQGNQQAAAVPTPTPRPPEFRHMGGMGMRRGY